MAERRIRCKATGWWIGNQYDHHVVQLQTKDFYTARDGSTSQLLVEDAGVFCSPICVVHHLLGMDATGECNGQDPHGTPEDEPF